MKSIERKRINERNKAKQTQLNNKSQENLEKCMILYMKVNRCLRTTKRNYFKNLYSLQNVEEDETTRNLKDVYQTIWPFKND